jgi:hypothetical protein
MRVRHSLTVLSACPVDGQRDVYEVEVEVDFVLPVEHILAAVSRLTKEALFQEALTERLARELGARVRTIGTHSGVKTVCEA